MITYKEALELLKTESPVYYQDSKKRKIIGVTWRRDVDSLVASVEVLDESINSVSAVSLNNIYTSEEDVEAPDTSMALTKINELIETLEDMKSCFRYEDIEKAKDLYNKLMRGSIRLDEEIANLSNDIKDRHVIGMIDKSKANLENIDLKNDVIDEKVGLRDDNESIYESKDE
jgi:hypothetical protein|nr:MAG TPA: hypothetical protein [Caudoviricetes sp.]